MDGWVTIGTKLDTKQLEKDIKNSEKKLQQYEKETEKLTQQRVKLDIDGSKAELELKKIDDKIQLINKEIKKMESANLPENLSDNLNYTKLLQQREELNQKQDIYISKSRQIEDSIDNIDEKIKQNVKEQQSLNTKIDEMNQKLQQAKGFENIKNSIKETSGAMADVIKKVAKWSLAILSIRSAYSFVRSAISTISQYNEQMATDIEYIRYALASSLQPVIEKIINLVRTLLSYINYIWKAWFGKELFASAKDFANMKKSASGTAKSVKEIKKELAGFDEMNILNEDGSVSKGGGIGSASLPSFDLDTDVPKPWWVEWIAKNKDTVLTIAKVLGGLFAASTVLGWLKNIGMLFGTAGGQGLVGLLSTLGQIALIGGGIIITGYIAGKFLQDVSDLKSKIDRINENNSKWQKEWLKNENDINNLINTGNVRRQAGIDLLDQSNNWLLKITGLSDKNLETVINTIKNYEGILDKEMEMYDAGKLNNKEKEKLLKSLEGQIAYNNTIIEKLKDQGKDTSELERINDKVKSSWQKINSEINTADNEIKDINNMKLNDKDLGINITTDEKKAESLFTKVFKSIRNTANNLLGGIFGGLANIVSGNFANGGIGFAKGGVTGFARGGVIKMATGSIISQPGRGVPISRAIGGEAGREGILPLENTAVMNELGRSIAEHMVVNLTNITKIDNRQLAREQKIINAQNDFAYNR